MGGEADYQNLGKLTRIWFSAVMVSGLGSALESYSEVLGLPMQLISREDNWIEPSLAEPHCKIAYVFSPSMTSGKARAILGLCSRPTTYASSIGGSSTRV